MAEHRIAGGVHAAVAFGAVADDAHAAGGGFGLREDIAHAHGFACTHAQVYVEGVEALDQRIAADVAENGLDVPALVQFAEMQGREAVGASRADHGWAGYGRRWRPGLGIPAEECGDALGRPFGHMAEGVLAADVESRREAGFLYEAVAVLNNADFALDGRAERPDAFHRQRVGEGHRKDVEIGIEAFLVFAHEQGGRAAGDDPAPSRSRIVDVEGRFLDHTDESGHTFRHDGIVGDAGHAGQGVLERERADFGERARMLFSEFDQPFAVAEKPAREDDDRGAVRARDVRRQSCRLVHFLMRARLEHGYEATFEEVLRIYDVLCGAWGKVTGDVVDEGTLGLHVAGNAGEGVTGLIEAVYFHGDHAVAPGHGVSHADADGHGFVHGPAHGDPVLRLRQALVDGFRARRAGVAVRRVDACAYAADRERDVSLQDFIGSCDLVAQLLDFVHGVFLWKFGRDASGGKGGCRPP